MHAEAGNEIGFHTKEERIRRRQKGNQMRLLFIRHAEPDYSIDSLTEKGHREAALLAKAAPSLGIDHCFVSPLGRAQVTADYCLKAMGKTAQTMEWLEEFEGPVDLNQSPELACAYPGVHPEDPAEILRGGHRLPASISYTGGPPSGLDKNGQENRLHHKSDIQKVYRLRRPWDIGQRYYAAHPELADPVRWRESEIYLHSEMPRRYDEVAAAFNDLLASCGYRYENGIYRVERENRETLAFFCHFGITCVLLSVLWNMSPFFLWQNLVMLPSTVTELISEEREQGWALFRAQRIGDQSHLFAGGERPSFAARYCEVYSDFSEETGRH